MADAENPVENPVEDAPLVVKLRRKTRAVKLEDPSGAILEYTLWELQGDEREEYMNFSTARTKIGPDGKARLADFKGVFSKLLSMSLKDANSKPVSQQVISKWPGDAQAALFEAAMALSGLQKPEGDTEGKE